MYIHPDAKLNGFRAVKIPTNAELFALTDITKVPKGHDGSNGSEWLEPDNPNGVDALDNLASAGAALSAAAIRYEREKGEAEKSATSDEQEAAKEPSATS